MANCIRCAQAAADAAEIRTARRVVVDAVLMVEARVGRHLTSISRIKSMVNIHDLHLSHPHVSQTGGPGAVGPAHCTSCSTRYPVPNLPLYDPVRICDL
jgi:hypothetical protein